MAHRGHIKLNEDKHRIIIVGTGKARVDIHVGEVQLEENDNEKLLGITFAKKLSIEKHIKHSVKKLLKRSMHLYVLQSTWNPIN